MPRIEEKEIGKIIQRRTVKTFGDQVKETLQLIAGAAIIGGLVFLALF